MDLKKTCKLHGVLKLTDIYQRRLKAGTQRTECLLCHRERTGVRRVRILKTPRVLPLVSKTCPKHGVLNPEHIYVRTRIEPRIKLECKICRRLSGAKSRKDPNYKTYHILFRKRRAAELRDNYIIDRLIGLGFKKTDITPELIEFKRVHIKLIREIRTRRGYGPKEQEKIENGK